MIREEHTRHQILRQEACYWYVLPVLAGLQDSTISQIYGYKILDASSSLTGEEQQFRLPDYQPKETFLIFRAMASFEETKQLLEHSTFYYIISTNMESRYTYVNNCYRKTFEPIHGPIVGERYEMTMHPDDTKVCEEVAMKCFANPESTFPATIRKHDGKGGYVITQWEYKAMWDDAGQPAGIFCLGHDITAYKASYEQLKNAQSLISQKESILREIAFNQSHVIRRPLANIIGLIKVLEKMEIDQNLRNICEMLMASSRQLDKVIKETADKTLGET